MQLTLVKLNHLPKTQAEREYIEANTPRQNSSQKRRLPSPLEVMTTVPFIALIVAYIGYNWGLHTMMTSGPIYMATILHLPVSKVRKQSMPALNIIYS